MVAGGPPSLAQWKDQVGHAAWYGPPFGVLNWLHLRALDARPLEQPVQWVWYCLVPLQPIFAQAFLLLGPQNAFTRAARVALGAAALGMMYSAWIGYRLEDQHKTIFNNALSIIFLHLVVKTVELAFLPQVVDPYMALGRPRVIAALDLCFNARCVSLGAVGLDVGAGVPNLSVTAPPRIEKHLRPTVKPGRYFWQRRPNSRLGATGRHALHMATHYVVLDTLLAIMRRMPDDLRRGGEGSLNAFLREYTLVLWPGFAVPDWVNSTGLTVCVAMVIWQALSLGYHVVATVCVGSGLWEVHSWDADLFDAPWKADSIIDVWGRRWHQVFRHQFIIVSTALFNLLGIPATPSLIFPMVFVLSGLLHVLGELDSYPVPSPFDLWAFFFLSGIGCGFELLFKKLTGRRVNGWAGRVWVWIYMMGTGQLATEAWVDAGVASCFLLPENGPGEWLGSRIIGTVFQYVPSKTLDQQ